MKNRLSRVGATLFAVGMTAATLSNSGKHNYSIESYLPPGSSEDLSLGFGLGMSVACRPETADALNSYLLNMTLRETNPETARGTDALNDIYRGVEIGDRSIRIGDITCQQYVAFIGG